MWKISDKLSRFEVLSLLQRFMEGKCTFCEEQAIARCKNCKRPVCTKHLLASKECLARRGDHHAEDN